MELNELLIELFGRVDEEVHTAVDGLDVEALTTAPAEDSNPIGWLVWHLTRVQDDHMADIFDAEQVWVTGDWGPRFGVASDASNTGWGHSPDDVMSIRPESAKALLDYYEAVSQPTRRFLATVTAKDLDRVVDTRWNPPVTLGVRLVSIADDEIQHAGQANYVRGILDRR
jgi:uncharacterized damage-inducible protein DinB